MERFSYDNKKHRKCREMGRGRILKRKWMSSMVVGIVWISCRIPAAQAEVNPIADARSASSDKSEPIITELPERESPLLLAVGVSKRIYPVETNRNNQYSGQLIFDDLTVEVPPAIEMPEEETTSKDPIIIGNDTIGKDRWKFAVLSDSQFVADFSR